jgi:hypothetical protein
MVNFEKGDQVIFVSSNIDQVKWGSNTDPQGILTEGNVYVVEDVEVHSWHTKLTFSGIRGKFNSVSFEKL